MPANPRRYARGHWISIGGAMGVALGAALGLALNNVAVGIAVGVAIGSGVGAVVEGRNKDKIRPLTDQERQMQKWGVLAGLLALLILAMAVVLLMFLTAR